MELNLKIKDSLNKHAKLREEKLNYFKKKGFPNKRLEDWKFTDLEKILKENFKELNNKKVKRKNPKIIDTAEPNIDIFNGILIFLYKFN